VKDVVEKRDVVDWVVVDYEKDKFYLQYSSKNLNITKHCTVTTHRQLK
jgi:hypothetical protein